MTLVAVQGSILLEANAAASFKRVDAKFGGALVITGPYGGHRSEADQAYLRTGYERRMAGWKGYSHFNYAAKPRQSNHEGKAPEWEGFAVDVSNYRLFPGLHAAMVAEGWERDPVELWHYNYRGKRTQVVGVAGNVINITPVKVETRPEVTIAHIKDPRRDTVYAIDLADGTSPLQPIGEAELYGGEANFVKTWAPTQKQFDALYAKRGVLAQDGKLRATPFAKATALPSHELINWGGYAVNRPL